MNLNKGLMAGLAMAAMTGESFVHRGQPSIAARGWLARVKSLTDSHSAHTPKPEQMFAPMLDDGSAKLIRRRNKPPLLIAISARRRF